MRNRKSISLLLAVVCGAPLVGLADGPTSRPTNRPGGERGPDHIVDRPDRPRPYRPGATRNGVTDDQWTQILAFMREKSPSRTDELERLIETADDKKANLLKSLIAAQYDYVMSLKTEDPLLYDLQIQKIQAQDNIFGMLKSVTKGAGMEAEVKKEFRVEVAKLVEVNLNERDRRIIKARESLAKAQATLEEDRKRKDSMVDDRMDQFLREGARPFKMDSPPSGSRSPDDQGATGHANPDAFSAAGQQLDAVLVASLAR